MHGSRKLPQWGLLFLVINVFFRGPHGPPSRSKRGPIASRRGPYQYLHFAPVFTYHGITESSEDYGNVRSIVLKTCNFEKKICNFTQNVDVNLRLLIYKRYMYKQSHIEVGGN